MWRVRFGTGAVLREGLRIFDVDNLLMLRRQAGFDQKRTYEGHSDAPSCITTYCE